LTLISYSRNPTNFNSNPNSDSDPNPKGTLNGVIMTAGSLGNAAGPILGSILYASAIDIPGPMDGRVVFFLGAIILVLIGLAAKIKMVDK
jgi:MFS family permease